MNAPLISGSIVPTFEEREATKLDNYNFQKEKSHATREETEKMLDETGNIF
jgi:hypothetical protein